MTAMKAYLEPHEIQLMENAATNFRDRLLIRLLFHAGCRVSEALALTVEDVDLALGTITIQHLKSRLKLSCSRCGAGLGQELAVTCNFQGQHGLIPCAPDMWYALDIVNQWLFPPIWCGWCTPEYAPDIWTALDVINAWLYPVQ